MPTGNAKRLAELGMAVPAAKELARQITAGTGSVVKLQEVGVVTLVAKLLVTAIPVLSLSVATRNGLANAGFPPALVKEFGTQIAS